MPMIGHRSKCQRCRENGNPRDFKTTVRLKRGPDGNRLCMKHFNEAWDKHFEIEERKNEKSDDD